MTAADGDDKTAVSGGSDRDRRGFGPRPITAVLPAVLRPAYRRHNPAAAGILTDWPDIVGPALAAVTLPRRLAQGTLTLACSGPVAMELSHLSDQLAARINQHVGHNLVQRLRFVPAVLPKPAQSAAPNAAAASVAAARRAVADMPPGALRDALERLGCQVLPRENVPPLPETAP